MDVLHIRVAGHIGEMRGKDFSALRVDLALPRDVEVGTLERQPKAADTFKQAGSLHIPTPLNLIRSSSMFIQQ